MTPRDLWRENMRKREIAKREAIRLRKTEKPAVVPLPDAKIRSNAGGWLETARIKWGGKKTASLTYSRQARLSPVPSNAGGGRRIENLPKID